MTGENFKPIRPESGDYVHKTAQKQPEKYFFAAKTTTEISKLQNYMSHVNVTWSSYPPPQHLSFEQRYGWR